MSATSATGTSPDVQWVSTIELFFDLIFVFTLAQLTSLISHPHDPTDYLKTILVFMTLMWIYDGFAWLTSNVVLATARQRQLIFLAMAGFFVMALSIPRVFAQGGLPYALGFLVVTCVHAGLFMTVPGGSTRAILRIAPFNFASVALVLAAAFVEPLWDWPLWLAAGVLLSAILFRRERGFDLSTPNITAEHSASR